MGNGERSPERMKRCPGCGAVDRSCNYGCPAERPDNQPEWRIEYVRADLHRGAVKALHWIAEAEPDPAEGVRPLDDLLDRIQSKAREALDHA